MGRKQRTTYLRLSPDFIARIEGDISYSTRKPMDAELKAIAGGSVAYDENRIREKREKAHDERTFKPTTFGVGKWIAFFIASFLFGCALLAVFGAAWAASRKAGGRTAEGGDVGQHHTSCRQKLWHSLTIFVRLRQTPSLFGNLRQTRDFLPLFAKE
jgi:hypothetical protein